MKKGLFLFADYFDSTTTNIRVLKASKDIFEEIKFLYWARLGQERNPPKEDMYKDLKFDAFKETASPRSLSTLLLFVKFQWWLFRKLLENKSNFLVAFTFYTIFPALIYKYCANWKCKVIYDPRDYAADSYRVNKIINFIIRFIDNLFIKFSDFVIFPDRQYFIYYGLFKLKNDKFLVLPNSTEDSFKTLVQNDIYLKYNLPKDKFIIPVIGYFSETRGEKILFDLIRQNDPRLLFVFAGDIRDENHLNFFKKHNNVMYLKKIPYLDALTIMKEALLVPQLYDPKLKNNVYALPTKYYDCLMVGTPVVVSLGQKDVAQEIVSNNFGWAIDYYDVPALMEIINKCIDNIETIDKQKLRTFFLENYDYNIHKSKLREAYLKLL
ncbi:hypothetical protein ATE47_11310 [Chryseobacterium sp. IHB B 17019]|jgi:hypothetical protein|uniref:hypothetical protein n=1 Tax=Chryseobacterium sp. IHB B 17019 TaxID=1721091 RepID=UPI00071F909F|nr:hypothetical protein [Chryseobacterium sp. IHB B 17019]ALR31076.1 hypothetical protein ATE47_11310 [Chryseobacterium sp. IHB B 17019]